MISLDERISKLESLFRSWPGAVPGSILARQLLPDVGLCWSLGLGGMQMPKIFFSGPTIDDVISQAENYILDDQSQHVLQHGEDLNIYNYPIDFSNE
jgi:hypothetical protein